MVMRDLLLIPHHHAVEDTFHPVFQEFVMAYRKY